MIGSLLLAVTALAASAPPDPRPAEVAFQWFWTGIVFASITWYAVLIFWLGTKGGIEIFRMIRALEQQLRMKKTEP